MSTYREIRSMVMALEQSSKVQERRNVAEKLQQKLALSEVRAKIAKEASSGDDVASRVKRRKALSELWRYIIRAAVVSMQKTVASKVKLRDIDILMPFKLLRCCDMPYETEEEVPGILPYKPSFLSRSETKLIFNYCFDMLLDDTALELAELELLENLVYLCSRKEYVANMRAKREIHAIMREMVESRILADDLPPVPILVKTGMIFESLIGTACSLGMDLQLLFSSSVKMVADWCSLHSKDKTNPHEMQHLMNGLATLLRSDLHQAVEPLSRHGRRIITFVRKAYSSAQTSDSRHALNEYIYAHLLVAETVGELQGLLTGDLGDLGDATLTVKHVNALLETLLEDIFKLDAGLVELNSHQQFHLELVARFFKCAQRSYLEDISWTSLHSELETGVSYLEWASSASAKSQAMTPKQLLGSPFWNILRFAFPIISSGKRDSQTQSDSMIQEMMRLSTSTVDIKSIIPVLRIVTTCAYHFPSGQCWTSSLHKWYDLGSIAGTIDGGCKRAFINLCNGDDLCLLIRVLADVLEWSGSNNGSTSLRVILLRCTNSLTKTMAVLVYICDPNATEINNLRLAWRRIWDILIRPDLAYHSSTKNGKSDCVAREVLVLFREMIVRSCLDSSISSTDTLLSRQSSYVYQHQNDIWTLPCYSEHIFASSECFLLLYSLLSRVGISESGTDSIELHYAQHLTGKEKITFSRRSRLLIYCLRAVESGMNEPRGAVVASCLGALVYGSASFLTEIFRLCALRDEVFSSHIPTSDVLCRLWMEPLLDPRIQLCPPMAESCDERNAVDIVLCEHERSIVFSEYVPDSEASSLLGLVTAVLLKPFDAPLDTDEVNEDSKNADDKDRMFGCWRYVITVLICSRGICAREQQIILATSTQLIRSFLRDIKLFSISIGSFWSAFSQMIIVIRTLSTITSGSSIELSSELLDEALRLGDICKRLLDSKTVPHLRRSHSPAEHSDVLFLEETDDEESKTLSNKVQGFERKRKRGALSSLSSAKKAALECVLPSPKCTIVVGALLLALDPSAKFACMLAGVENVESASPGDFDVFGAAIAAHLLCMEEPLLSGFAAHTLNGGGKSSEQKKLFLIHRLLSMIRGASPPEDDFHVFGFQLSEKIVTIRDDPFLAFPLNSEESNCLKELIVDAISNIERKTFQTRPPVRAIQFQSAINSFSAAGDTFHEAFDKDFARTLVLPSLFDTNNHVRSIASRAVACAIRLLPEGKVTESIRKRLFLFDADGSDRKQYREWYTAKIVDSADLGTLERQVWEDLFLSMRGTCLNHWCALASESTNDGVLKQLFFDLVLVAKTTPACEGLCFQSLSHMARLKGEQNCELFIDHCVTYLVDRWQERELSLLDFPLFITSPVLVRELLKHGHCSRLLLVSNGDTSDFEEMRRVASADFVARFSKIIIPRVLLSFVKKRLNKGTSTDLRLEIADDGYIKELCLVFTDHFDEEQVRKFLGSSLPETVAYLSWLSNESDDNCNAVQKMEQLLLSLLSEEVFVRRLKSHSFNAQKYLLYLSLSASLSDKNDIFLKAHNTLSMMMSTQFSSASYILLFFYARYLMCVRLKFSSPRVIWIPFENVIALGETLAENDPRCISFCQIAIKLVSCVLGDGTFQKIHIFCLPLLTLLSNKLLNVGGESLFSDIFGDLLLVVFQVLDESISFLIDQTELSRSARHAKLTRSLGLIGGHNISRHLLGDTWRWCESVTFDMSTPFKRCPKRSAIVEACLSFVSSFVTKCSNSQSLETKLVEAYQASRLSSISRDSLRDFKSLLDVRGAIEKLVGRTNTDFVSGTEIDVATFISDVPGQGENINRGKTRLSNYPAIYKNRLINKLVRLEKVLHDSRSGKVMLQPLKSSHVQTLGLLCSSGFPRKIRLAASRCFGELNMSTILWDKEYPLVGEYWLYSAVTDNRLLRTLQARCIETLLVVLESPNPLNSSISAHTLTSVLSTRVGAECRGLIVNEVSALLEIFYSHTKRSTIIIDKQLFLEGHEIALIRTKCGVDEDSVTSWCWAPEAWSSARSSSFEEWLCAIVPSIILCLYSVSGEVNKNEMEFFWLLQKITFLESSVAAALFPALIVDLLHRAPDGATHQAPAEEDLIDKIGGCFETLLKQCTGDRHTCDSQERQYLDLILNTLEVLRHATQAKFMSSRSQRKSRLTDEISKNEKNENSSRASVCSCVRAIPWSGLRFGVILHLDGYLVMRAFLKAGRVTAAILYAEMYADSQFGGSSWTRESINAIVAKNVTAQCGSGHISGKISHRHTSISSAELAFISRNFLSTLRRCYEELEETDNLKALTQFVADIDVHSPENFLSMLRGKDDVFESCHSLNEYQATIGFANGLDQLGLDFALQHYISGTSMNPSIVLSENDTAKMKEKWYKCQLTRMCWADSVFQENNYFFSLSQEGMDLRPGFFESAVNAARAMERSDYNTCCEHVEEARWNLLLSTFNMDARSESEGIFRAASYLRSLNDWQRFVRSDESDDVRLPPALEDCGTFRSQRELPLYCRELVLRHNIKKNSGQESKHFSLLLDQLWQTSSMSLKCGDLRMASGALSRIHTVLNSQKEKLAKSESFLPMTLRLRMEETLLLEKSGNFTSAITSTQRTIERLSQQMGSLSVASQALLSELMLNCSRWMAKYKTDPIHHVLTNVLSPGKDIAIGLLKSNPNLESNINRASECLLTMSSLGHVLFESGLKRINSLEFQRSEKCLASRRVELDECKRLQKSSQTSSKQSKDPSDLAIFEHNLSKEIRQMESERSETFTALNAHLKVVLEATSQAFMIVGTNRSLGLSTFAYRLIGVWFSAIEENLYNDDVDNLIHEAIERIPSFRFVPLANQLFARLENTLGNASHHERLQGLIVKLCLDHPYHCLVHLIAACNGNNVGKGVDGRSAATFLKNTSDSKIEAAHLIVQTVKQKDPGFVSCLFESYRTLSDAYIHLAMAEVKRAQKINFASISAKSSERLDSCLGRRGRSEFMPCILTKPPPIRPGRDYGEGREDPKQGERVLGFDAYFITSESGVHVPKIVVCKGTKGGSYRQLVKGQDEIRQDAVMQQVFGLLNEFVAQNQNSESSRKHALHQLVTYSIVPLTPTSGVLEWVENSAPFGDLIVDKKIGLHPRYFPDEWANKICYSELQDAKRGEAQLAAFERICSHYSPSFRYFFLERFGHAPEKWYDAKMRFTRSVAVSSMVGHVLGIGDRHCSNILVHEKSGEVVHIDFGYVFEQGKLLAIPEKVPFRLTRNVIDGMGITGTDGLFTKISESTMYLLKSNTNALLTILSAMASDPLYKWSLSPMKVQNRGDTMQSRKKKDGQDDHFDHKEKNKAAARAISRVHEKLQGYEDGTAGEQQSVEGQVQLLINSARDHGNLSSMYPGWQPWI